MVSRKQWVIIAVFTAYGALSADVSTAAGFAGALVGGFAITYGLTTAYNNWRNGPADGTHQNPYASDDENYVGNE